MSESNNTAWNNILTVLFIILFLVALVILVEKTDAIKRIKEEYTNNVPDDAKETIENVFAQETSSINIAQQPKAISL